MKALLIIDVQNDYFPGGKCELTAPLDALKNIKSVLQHFRKAGLPVIHIQHINLKLYITHTWRGLMECLPRC